ncbi:MAG: hypothetical protein JJU21_16520 [Salinarimonas sp.]|nr:hypothetical protein [Salinarimonas sp.]
MVRFLAARVAMKTTVAPPAKKVSGDLPSGSPQTCSGVDQGWFIFKTNLDIAL